eukprot:m.289156 g.289156  ORF g.289156 m.289156 type:complete len:58 (-) comp186309_c0_seq1:41-214(-)
MWECGVNMKIHVTYGSPIGLTSFSMPDFPFLTLTFLSPHSFLLFLFSLFSPHSSLST